MLEQGQHNAAWSLPQAKPSILTLGFPSKEDLQVGDPPLSTLPAGFMPGEFPREEDKNWACLANCTSWMTGLSVRTGGEPQKKPI